MAYLIVFIEGIVTFISPCLLPMLPLYLSYFAGGDDPKTNRKVLYNALGFVFGFTLVFVSLGAFAGTLGQFILKHGTIFNLFSGLIIVVFGLSFLGVINLPSISFNKKLAIHTNALTPLKSILFGIVFSISWTPCVSAFLGSALILASQQGSVFKGIIMLLLFSAGLAIPFIASAVLLNSLKSTFDFLKKHYKTINYVSGSILILLGILMMAGRLI
ncbi:MAG: sulfite exporter TauE/SafE family protein [Peptostreptococcaceae bacterium]|nr:sulfite exporter TauE/SafE family protein [Peptostreptococcaceae bacterium]